MLHPPPREVTVLNRVQFLTGHGHAHQPHGPREPAGKDTRPRAPLAVFGLVFTVGMSFGMLVL